MVDSEFDMDTYLIDIGYSFVRSERWEVMLGAGLHAFDFETEYRITERFGIGATYQYSEINVTSDNSIGYDELEVDFSGPNLYLSYGF